MAPILIGDAIKIRDVYVYFSPKAPAIVIAALVDKIAFKSAGPAEVQFNVKLQRNFEMSVVRTLLLLTLTLELRGRYFLEQSKQRGVSVTPACP